MPGTTTPRAVARGGSLAHPHLIAATEQAHAEQLAQIVAGMSARSATTGGVR